MLTHHLRGTYRSTNSPASFCILTLLDDCQSAQSVSNKEKISQSNNILYKLEVELILIVIFRHFSSAGSELKGLESGRGERCSPHV